MLTLTLISIHESSWTRKVFRRYHDLSPGALRDEYPRRKQGIALARRHGIRSPPPPLRISPKRLPRAQRLLLQHCRLQLLLKSSREQLILFGASRRQILMPEPRVPKDVHHVKTKILSRVWR